MGGGARRATTGVESDPVGYTVQRPISYVTNQRPQPLHFPLLDALPRRQRRFQQQPVPEEWRDLGRLQVNHAGERRGKLGVFTRRLGE
jgi:hypothetical protein